MKIFSLFAMTMIVTSASFGQASAGKDLNDTTQKSLFIDVHDLEPGKVTFADVMGAHQKDLATQGKYGVSFIKVWVDEQKGKVYCLSSAKDAQSITKTHAEAHGLLPADIFKVTGGSQASAVDGKQFFIDIHDAGPGNVTAAAVEDIHSKDLAVQKKYGVNFINYWVDEKTGTVFCLSQAPDSTAIINTHKEAHGYLPSAVMKVKQGE